jgi:hypothetical protein
VDAERLQALLTALVRHRIAESLADVEAAVAAWRRGERDVLEAHAELLRHAARASSLSARVTRAAVDGPTGLLRDALDAGLLDADEFRRLTGKEPDDVTPPPAAKDDEAGIGEPDKRLVLEKLLEEGPVLVHLDPRRAGVDVPPVHRDGPRLVLRFGHGLTPPILDLVIDAAGVVGTLMFHGQPYRCHVPWPAVFAIVGEDSRGLVWPPEVPAEVAHEYRKGPEPSPPGPPDAPKPKRGHLKLV